MEESPAESCRRAIGASNQRPAQHDAEVAASESRSTASRGRAASQQGAEGYAACDAPDECDRDCRCPRGQPCDGRCNDKWSGDRLIRMMFGKRVCVACKGVDLPQTDPELHKLVRQLQQQSEQRDEVLLNGLPNSGCAAKLQAAEQHLVRSDSARHAAEEKLQRLMQQVKQLQAQHQLAVEEAQAKEQEQAKRVAAAEKNAKQLAAKVDGLQTEKLRHVEDMEVLEERLASLSAQEEAAAADLRLCKAQAADLQQDLTREREEMQMMEERLSAANASEEDMLADMRAIKEQLASAQSQLALTTTSSSEGHDDGTGRVKAQPQPPAVVASASSKVPEDIGCVEQRACLDQLTVAVEQLVAVLTQGSNTKHPVVQQLLQAAKEEAVVSAAGAGVGYDLGISRWDSNAASAALHSHVLTPTLRTVQQLPWPPPSPFDICLASCPESGRTDLQAAMQQLQQAKSSTLFLVAQQQSPSHPATREAAGYVEGIRRHMQQQLEQQLGLDKDIEAGKAWQPQLLAVAAAMTRVNLLLASLQGSCPGLQLVSSLEDWAAPEGQRACEAPVRQLLGKVQSSRPLFLVRPGLVCPAAGGGRQVLVRQQLVALVPDPAKPGSATPNSPFLTNATDSRVKELAKQLQLAELEQRGGAAALHKAEAGRLQPVRLSHRHAKRQAEYPHSLPALSPPSSPLHGYRQRQDGPGSGGVHAFQVDRLAAAHPPSPVPGWLAASTLHQSPAPPSTPTHVHAAPLTSVNTPSSLVGPKSALTLKKGAGSGAKAAAGQAPAAAAKSVGRLSPVTAAPWPLLSEVRSRVNLVFNSDPESPQASPVSSVASLAAQFDSCSSAKKLNWSASMTDTEPLPGGQGVSESD